MSGMSGDMEMQVTLKLRDQLSAESVKALSDLRKGVGATVTAVIAATRASQDSGRAAAEAGKIGQNAAAQTTAAVQQQTTATAAQATRDLARDTAEAKTRAEGMAKALKELGYRDRNILGVAERIKQVDQYARRAEQGLLGAARAAGRFGQAVAQGGAALAAGGYVAGRALAPAMDYDTMLTRMANTAYSDDARAAGNRSVWVRGKAGMDAAITGAVRRYGGTRESAAEALDKMLASGAVDAKDALRMLPVLQKAATASGASTADLSAIAIRGIQGGFFKANQVGSALDKAIIAGQMGGFELKDIASWLPQMMANAKGMKSMAGYESILANAQAAVTTAGTTDQGGNNLRDLLAEMNAHVTDRAFKKLHIDLAGTLAKARENGVMPLDAFVDLVQKQVVGKDPRFQQLLSRANAAKASGDKAGQSEALAAAADVMEGSAIGKVMRNQQSLQALVGLMAQREYVAKIRAAEGQATGFATDFDFKNVQGTTGYKLQQAKNEKDIAASGMFDKVGGPLGRIASAASDLARRFPGLATASYAAATALSAVAAAGGVVAAGKLLFGGGAAAGAAGATGAAAGATSRVGRILAAGKSGWAGSLGRWGGRLGGLFGLASAGFDIYGTEHDATLTRAQKNAAHTGTAFGAAGGWAGALLGAKAGAAVGGGIGALFGGVGAVPGAAIGGVLGGIGGGIAGWWGGNKLGQKAGDVLFGGGQTVVRNEIKLVADGRQLAAVVNEVNSRQAQRH